MAKDTEKLIRQLSLISYLMAERRPVTALEIRRDVEGYSGMNEDAFARRFYADRAELESLGIHLTVDRPVDGVAEQENYSLRPENFHLPAIAFTDEELASLQSALTLLDGEFAYAEPLRLALQQISWGRPSPLQTPEQRSLALGLTGSAGGHDLSQRLAKIETAIFRNKTITFDYYTMERDEIGARARSTPTTCSTRAASSTCSATATSAARCACSASRASAARSPTRPRPSTTSSGPPASTRAPTPTAPTGSSASPPARPQIWISDRIAWQIERHFGRFGEIAPGRAAATCVFTTPYASARQIAAWALRLGEHARVLGPPELRREIGDRVELLAERHAGEPELADAPPRAPDAPRRGADVEPRRAAAAARGRDPPRALRAPRDARLDPDRGRPRRACTSQADRGLRAACRSPTPSCARTSTC